VQYNLDFIWFHPQRGIIRLITQFKSDSSFKSKTIMKITNALEEITVFEKRSDFFKAENPTISILEAHVSSLNCSNRSLSLKSGDVYHTNIVLY
jgi:hypothetical protein